MRTNDANNYIVGQISKTVFGEVRNAASTNASRGFLDRIFINFSDLHDKTAEAAKGADDLKGGISKAKQGSKDLADGLKDSKAGSKKLSDGIVKLNQGSRDLATGSQQVAGGTQVLADKVNGIAGDVRPFFKDNGKSIRDTARLVADTSAAARHNLDVLVKTAPTAATDARKAADELAEIHRTQCEEAEEPDATACPPLERAKVTAEDAAKISADVNTLVTNQNGDLKKLSTQLTAFQKQAEALAKRAPTLDDDLASAVAKVNELNTGAKKVAKGAQALHTGLSTAQTGSSNLDTGVGKLKTGAENLDGGLFRLGDGSAELAQGLNDGVEKIPDYDKKDRDARTDVMADPVQLASEVAARGPQLRHRLRPVLHPAVPVGRRDGGVHADPADEPAGARRRGLLVADRIRRLAPGRRHRHGPGRRPDGRPALGPRPPDGARRRNYRLPGPGDLLLRRDRAVAERLLRGGRTDPGAGRADAPADLGRGYVPRPDEPRILRRDPPVPPMTYVVEGLRRLITGGPLTPVWVGCAVLAAFTVGALALTAFTARRKQVWSLSRLHPELSL